MYVCVCLHADASPLGAKEKRADATCRRQDVPVYGSVWLKKEALLGTLIPVGAPGETQEHPNQASYGRSEHPSKAHTPSAFRSHSIYRIRAD